MSRAPGVTEQEEVEAVMNRHDVEARDTVEPDRLPQLVDLYAREWWSAGRTADDVARMLRASDVVVALAHRPTGSWASPARSPTASASRWFWT